MKRAARRAIAALDRALQDPQRAEEAAALAERIGATLWALAGRPPLPPSDPPPALARALNEIDLEVA